MQQPVRIHKRLYPLAFLYGIAVGIRNRLFDWGLLRSCSFDIPVICIGNITVGGTGKTPHTEYLIRLLQKKFQVAVLSRGYKRKSKGFILATMDTPVSQIGDEPYQMKQKFPNAHVAVDADRRNGIRKLCKDNIVPEADVILLDDAYQHRYVTPGINILLTDYNRLICEDTLLPAGRMREPASGKNRANIIIVTKCPRDIKPMEYRIITNKLDLRPYQSLYFSAITYGELTPLSTETTAKRPLNSLNDNDNILLLTGIASPKQIIKELNKYTNHIESIAFPDHHNFSDKDIEHIKHRFNQLNEGSRLIITTEKDATRLIKHPRMDKQMLDSIYVLPIEIEFLQEGKEFFNNQIIRYVTTNSRNCIIHKKQNDNKS